MSSAEEIRAIALVEFASAGYGATSIQRLADAAGLSKSAVLYHFPSKEILLEAAISPAIDRMDRMIDSLLAGPLTAEARRRFVSEFADFLLEYRLPVHMFINQGQALVDVPVIERANALVARLAEYFSSNTGSVEETMRFAIALGGAAYMLCRPESLEIQTAPTDEVRAALVAIMTSLLLPAGRASLPAASPTA